MLNYQMQFDRHTLPYRQSTSAVILDNQNQILLVQKNIYKENEWDIPEGGVDPGEIPHQTILRELQEELGSNKFEIIQASQEIDTYEWSDEYITLRFKNKNEKFRGQQRVQFLAKFTGNPSDIHPQPKEIRQVKWINLDQLNYYLVFPNQLKKQKHYLKNLAYFKLSNKVFLIKLW